MNGLGAILKQRDCEGLKMGGSIRCSLYKQYKSSVPNISLSALSFLLKVEDFHLLIILPGKWMWRKERHHTAVIMVKQWVKKNLQNVHTWPRVGGEKKIYQMQAVERALNLHLYICFAKGFSF